MFRSSWASVSLGSENLCFYNCFYGSNFTTLRFKSIYLPKKN